MRAHHLTAAAGAVLLLAGCTSSGLPSDQEATPTPEPAPTEEETATAEEDVDDRLVSGPDATGTFTDPDGGEVGTVELFETDDGVEVRVEVTGLEPGFHGLHVHESGLCEPESSPPDDPDETGAFLSAGGHLNPDEADHGEHAGDLGALLVTAAGRGASTQLTDRFAVADLRDDDGTAFMIHSDPDNFAHIPERYGQPDEDTLGTGDAGDRVACAVID